MERREILVWLFFCGSLALISVLACDTENQEAVLGECCRPDVDCEVTTRDECKATPGSVFDETNESCNGCPAFVDCCIDGVCARRTMEDCLEVGSIVDSCPSETCIEPVGACCLRGTVCEPELKLRECEALAGVWLGPDTDCGACFDEGACQFTTGACFEMLAEECNEYDRVLQRGHAAAEFQGPGSKCSDAGSCILDDGTCIQTNWACSILLGYADSLDIPANRFMPGVPCPTGACNFEVANGPCRVLTRHSCIVAGGIYVADGATCAEGACRTDDGCEVVTFLQCEEMTGEYMGDGSECPPTGACCMDIDCRPALTLAECAAAGGRYQGDNVKCEQGLCEEVATGACCTPDGCTEISEEACDLVDGGEYLDDGVTCESEPCPQGPPMGACCLFDGGCINGPLAEICLAWKEGVSCEDDTDPCIGTCCLFETGGCRQITGEECAADPGEGVFYGPNFGCDACPDADMGACLTLDGCIRTTRDDCNGRPGEYLGHGTICPQGRGGVAADGGGGGVPGASLGCAKSCMEEVSAFLVSCNAQGTGIDSCAPAANRIFQDCLSSCAPGCDKDCMTESSVNLTLCLAFGTPLETCLSAARPSFAACLSNCPADCETDCLDTAASQVSDCLLGGGDPVECGKSADALIKECLTGCLEPPTPMTPQRAGDCNQDGAVNVADVTCIVRILFQGFNLLDGSAPEMPCATTGGDLAILDVSANEVIDVADIVGLAGFLFGGGAPPPGGATCQLVDAGLGCPENGGCQ